MPSARANLPLLFTGQAAKETTVNTALTILEALTVGGVLSKTLANPPASPTEGDTYVVPLVGTTGVFAGKENYIAHWYNAAWKFYLPQNGWSVRVIDDNYAVIAFDGVGWVELASNVAYVDVTQQFTKTQGNVTVALTNAPSITVDGSLSNKFTVTLTGNRVLANPTNLKDASYTFTIKQDGTGSRTLTYGSNFKFPGGTVPVLSTLANAVDELRCQSDGTVLRCVMYKDFK